MKDGPLLRVENDRVQERYRIDDDQRHRQPRRTVTPAGAIC